MTDIFTKATITTDRLRLEPFAKAHAIALNTINNEPQVMEFLSDGNPQTLDKTRADIARIRERWTRLGFGWWTIIAPKTETIIGAACAQNCENKPGAEIEIGWRLSTSANGHGYATEAGKAAADFVFDVVGVDHVIATADQNNFASHRVMERMGMTFRGIEPHYSVPCTTYVLHKADRDWS